MNIFRHIIWTSMIALAMGATSLYANEGTGADFERAAPIDRPWPQPPRPTGANPLQATRAARAAAIMMIQPPMDRPWPPPPQPTGANATLTSSAVSAAATMMIQPPMDRPWPPPPQPTGANATLTSSAVSAAATMMIQPPMDRPWPPPPQPMVTGPRSISTTDHSALLNASLLQQGEIASAAVMPCCHGQQIIGGGYATRASNYDATGQLHQRLDVLFTVRLPTGIKGLDTFEDFTRANIVMSFVRGNQKYAQCGLELSLHQGYAVIGLAIDSVDQRLIRSRGRCDLNLDENGIRSAVPQADMQDTIEVFALGEFGKIQLGRSAPVNYFSE